MPTPDTAPAQEPEVRYVMILSDRGSIVLFAFTWIVLLIALLWALYRNRQLRRSLGAVQVAAAG